MKAYVMGYWTSRSHLKYYAKVKELLEGYGRCHSVMDIGSRDTPIATWGDFAHRYAVDSRITPKLDGVAGINGTWPVIAKNLFRPRSVSVLTCLQVLEHTEDPAWCAEWLFAVAFKWVIVSVPYKWPGTADKSHVHDPVDEDKLMEWTCRVPWSSDVIADGNSKRLVVQYRV